MKRLSDAQQRKVTGILMTLPSFIVILVFFLIPLASTIKYSFTDWNGVSAQYRFIGLDNFIGVVTDTCFKQIVFNTVYLIVLYVPVLNVLALIFAVLIFNIGRKIGNIVKSVLFFPCLLSMVVVGFIWKLLFNYNSGLINQLLKKIGLGFLATDWLGQASTVLPSMSVSIIWFAMGYYLVIYTAGLMTIPKELYEASDVAGANAVQKFFHITIPLLAQSITINVVLSTIGIISCFDLPFVLTEGGPGYLSETIALKVYHYAFASQQHGYSLALAIMLAVLAIVIALIELKLLLKMMKTR